MKKLILGFMLLAAQVKADGFNHAITAMSGSVAEVTGNTTSIETTAGYTYVMVMNLDTSNDLYCSNDSSVASSGSHTGVPILHQIATTVPFNFFVWKIPATMKFYCVASGGTPNALIELWR